MSAHAVPSDPAPRRPFQFTLRSIFLLTTLTAVFLSAYFAGSEFVRFGCVLFAMAVLPVSLTVALIHGRGYLRTFCIGALIPGSMNIFLGGFLLFVMIDGASFDSNEILLFGIGVPFVVSLAAGALAMAVRSVVEGPRPTRQSSSSTPSAGHRGMNRRTCRMSLWGRTASQLAKFHVKRAFGSGLLVSIEGHRL